MNTAVAATPESNKLPEPVARRGLDEAQWRTLKNSLFPGAKSDSILMVVDYCKARKLDPLKKPCHIVPMRVKDAQTGEYGWRDVVMPGIYEYRTTAQRTGDYLGHAKPEYGDFADRFGVRAPEWCDFMVYRWNNKAQQRIEFTVRVYFAEVVALKDGHANDRWNKAPVQMLTKCAEAAALREAFPDEFGGEMTAEEMDGRSVLDAEPTQPQRQLPAMPEGFDAWLSNLEACADNGSEALATMWASEQPGQQEYRAYLTATDPHGWERVKARAAEAA